MRKDSIQLKIDHARCVNCGDCIEECSYGVLTWDAAHYPAATESAATRCIHCQHCVMICPAAALSIDGINPDACPASGGFPTSEQMLNLIRGRRSIRQYQQRNVNTRLQEKLISAIRYSPTGVNDHRLHVTVIDNIAAMNEFRNIVNRKIITALNAAEVPPLWKPFQALKDAIEAGKDPVFRTAPHLLLISSPEDAPCAQADPLIALSYFELLAQSSGVGTVWLGRLMNLMNQVLPELRDLLQIPAGYLPVYAMLYGYPNLNFVRCGSPEDVAVKRLSEKDFAD